MRKRFFLATALLCLSNGATAAAVDLDQAIADQERIIRSAPNDWSAHAKLSYLQWQVGDVTDAVSEGQRAIFAAPGNPLPLVNLAHIYQSIGEFDSAIPFYEKAKTLAPNDWVAWVSLARCHFGKDQMAPGLEVLKEMQKRSSDDFAWHYQLGVSFNTVDHPDLAVAPLERAVALAPTGGQKAAALGELMVAALRDKKVDLAKRYLDAFLASGCVEGQPYVQVAAAFPDATIFDTAFKTLKDNHAAGTFFRLGRVYEAAGKLELAEKSFMHSIELNPGAGESHVGLAMVLDTQGKKAEAVSELEQAAMFDASDFATKFLLEHRDKKLMVVDFHAEGVSCGCQTTRIENGFRAQKGVALVAFERKAPYHGMLLIDPSEVTTDAAFTACVSHTFPAGGESVPFGFKFVSDRQNEVGTVHDTIALTQQEVYGDPTTFHRKFDPIQPTLAAGDKLPI